MLFSIFLCSKYVLRKIWAGKQDCRHRLLSNLQIWRKSLNCELFPHNSVTSNALLVNCVLYSQLRYSGCSNKCLHLRDLTLKTCSFPRFLCRPPKELRPSAHSQVLWPSMEPLLGFCC